MNYRIACFGWIDPIAEVMLSRTADVMSVAMTPATAAGVLATAHGYQVSPRGELPPRWECNADVLARAPQLLAACSTGAGYDVIDVAACTAAGVIVCNQSGTNSEAVAEHTLGLMLALSKRIGLADKRMRREADLDRFSVTGSDIFGKTVGLVGIGQIGSRVAELCRGLFRMEVLACDPYLTDSEVAARGARRVSLDELLQASDFVSVHCPRSTETMGMFGAARFSRMKRNAFFIQTARGGIHDEAALADALRSNTIAGAGVDVFLSEPPRLDHPLLQLDNVIATPHIAGVTFEARRNMAVAAAEQWMAIFRGEIPPRLVNPEAWASYRGRFRDAFGITPPAL